MHGAVIRGDGGDHVAHPAEHAPGADPHAGSDDQPEDPAQEIPVVELSQAGEQGAEHGGGTGFFIPMSHSLD